MRAPHLIHAGAATLLLCLAALPSKAADREVTVVNKTGEVIAAFHSSSAGTGAWGDDILGQQILLPGGEMDIIFDIDTPGACRFDFKAVLEDGDEVFKRRVDVCKVRTFSLAP